MKMTWNRKIIFVFLAAVLFFAAKFQVAKAASPLELIINEPIFDVTNAVPGDSFSSPVTLLNHGDHHEIFQFEFDIKTNPEALADHLFFKVTDGTGNCLYGCASNLTLASLDRKEPDIARVGPHSTTDYNFILTFDPNVGNELQSALTTFDMKLGFEGVITRRGGGGGGGAGGAAGPGAAPAVAGAAFLAGLPGAGAVAGEVTGEQPAGEVKGEEAPSGEVQGAEACHGWPKWIWVLMLVVYFAAFLWRTFDKFKEQVEKREIRWKWQAALAVAAFLVWYFFDKCREYWWFVIIALVGGAVVYLAYLYLFRERIKESREEIESGSEQKPPETPTGPEA